MFEKQFSDAEFVIIQKKKETRAIRYNILEYDRTEVKCWYCDVGPLFSCLLFTGFSKLYITNSWIDYFIFQQSLRVELKKK